MKEAPFQSWVIEVAERFHWRAWHVPFPVRGIGGGKFVPETRAAGLPDLILMREDPARLIFAEIKGEKGRLSTKQKEFLDMVNAVSDASGWAPSHRAARGYVWQPGDEELIETILRTTVLM